MDQMDPADLSNIGTEREKRRTIRKSNSPSGDRMWRSHCRHQREPRRPQTVKIINMAKTLNGAIAAVSQYTARTQRAYDQLRAENIARDRALTDLSEIVKEYGSSPVIQADVLDEEGNLHATDIGITWENNETFLQGVRVVGLGPPRPTGMGPVMSTPYQPMRGQDRDNTSTTALPPTPKTQKWFRKQTSIYAGRRQRLVRDTDRRHPFNGSTTSP